MKEGLNSQKTYGMRIYPWKSLLYIASHKDGWVGKLCEQVEEGGG